MLLKLRRFCHLAAGLRDEMYALAVGMLGDEQDAAAAVERTVHTAYGQLFRRRTLECGRPWLLRILFQECADNHPDGRTAVPENSGQENLWQVVCSMEPEYRNVVLLRDYMELRPRDIAMILDTSPKTVRHVLAAAQGELLDRCGKSAAR